MRLIQSPPSGAGRESARNENRADMVRLPEIARISLLALALLLWLVAPTPATEHAQKVDDFMQRTGVERLLQVTPTQIAMKFDYIRRNAALLSATRNIVIEVMKEVFAAEGLMEVCRAALMTNTEDDAKFGAVLDLLKNPLYVKMRQLHLDIPANPEEVVEAYWDEFKKKQDYKIRADLVLKLIKAERAVASNGTMGALMSFIIPRVMNAVDAQNALPTDEEVWNMVQKEYKRYVEKIASILVMSAIYQYRDATDNELKHFTGLMESPAGQDYIRYLDHCLLEPIYHAARQMELKIRERLQ